MDEWENKYWEKIRSRAVSSLAMALCSWQADVVAAVEAPAPDTQVRAWGLHHLGPGGKPASSQM